MRLWNNPPPRCLARSNLRQRAAPFLPALLLACNPRRHDQDAAAPLREAPQGVRFAVPTLPAAAALLLRRGQPRTAANSHPLNCPARSPAFGLQRARGTRSCRHVHGLLVCGAGSSWTSACRIVHTWRGNHRRADDHGSIARHRCHRRRRVSRQRPAGRPPRVCWSLEVFRFLSLALALAAARSSEEPEKVRTSVSIWFRCWALIFATIPPSWRLVVERRLDGCSCWPCSHAYADERNRSSSWTAVETRGTKAARPRPGIHSDSDTSFVQPTMVARACWPGRRHRQRHK